MLKLNRLFALALCVTLVACESAPKPGPAPATAAPSQTTTGSSGNALETQTSPVADAPAGEVSEDGAGDAAAAQPEPVDVDQLAYAAAVEDLKNGATESALAELQRLGEIAAEKPRLFTNLGLAYFRLQQFEPAEASFREAIERDASDAVAYNHLGILQRRKGQFQQALQAYQRAIEIDVKYAHAHLNLGILFDLYLQDLEKALQQYRIYQSLTNEQNEQVAGWIVDIERRLKSDG